MFFSVKTKTGLPTRGSFSIDSQPSLKRRTHLETVVYFNPCHAIYNTLSQLCELNIFLRNFKIWVLHLGALV